MYIENLDRCEESILSESAAVIPGFSSTCGWPGCWWADGLSRLQWRSGHTSQRCCSYGALLRFSETDTWNPYTISDLHGLHQTSVGACFQKFCLAPPSITWFFRADKRAQSHFCVHIFVYGNRAVMTASACQIDSHGPVSGHSVMRMVNIPDLRFCCFFLGIIIRLPVFPVVVISVWTYRKPSEKPADAKLLMIPIYKPISR